MVTYFWQGFISLAVLALVGLLLIEMLWRPSGCPIITGCLILLFGIGRLFILHLLPPGERPEVLTTSIIAIAVALLIIIQYVRSGRDEDS